jgi:cellulose synthase/poly-beta-1,6-N-acetylglucosamine synthase-like glycosyltransferase
LIDGPLGRSRWSTLRAGIHIRENEELSSIMLHWLGLVFVGLTLLGSAFLFLVAFGLAYLLWLHLTLRREGIASETRLLAQPLPQEAALPHVVVQIPVFNEGTIVERAVVSIANLDWPKEKLHIQVCDDSTDATTGIASAAAERARAAGIDVVIFHRSNRNEFKAGALNEARQSTGHDYFAIFDVDYVPPADFLRRCMAVLLAQPRLAFVQARPDFLNIDENAFARAQAILLDFHYGLEQPTRGWANQMLPFNGTCGIWRRTAIEAAGGWRGDTLTEDWDLSYRAMLKGWRGVFLATVAVPGELPAKLGAWISQQRRWAAGIGEVCKKMLPALLFGTKLSRRERSGALLPLGTWFGYVLFPATFFSAVIAILLVPSIAWLPGLVFYASLVATTVALFALMRVANRFVGRAKPLASFALDFALVLALAIYISWANFRSIPATLIGRRRVFVRTPKEGSVVSAGGGPR